MGNILSIPFIIIPMHAARWRRLSSYSDSTHKDAASVVQDKTVPGWYYNSPILKYADDTNDPGPIKRLQHSQQMTFYLVKASKFSKLMTYLGFPLNELQRLWESYDRATFSLKYKLGKEDENKKQQQQAILSSKKILSREYPDLEQIIMDSNDTQIAGFFTKVQENRKVFKALYEINENRYNFWYNFDRFYYNAWLAIAMYQDQHVEMMVNVLEDQRELFSQSQQNEYEFHVFIKRNEEFMVRQWLQGVSRTPDLAVQLHCFAMNALNPGYIYAPPMPKMAEILLKTHQFERIDNMDSTDTESKHPGLQRSWDILKWGLFEDPYWTPTVISKSSLPSHCRNKLPESIESIQPQHKPPPPPAGYDSATIQHTGNTVPADSIRRRIITHDPLMKLKKNKQKQKRMSFF